jgi:hypothetical protein
MKTEEKTSGNKYRALIDEDDEKVQSFLDKGFELNSYNKRFSVF